MTGQREPGLPPIRMRLREDWALPVLVVIGLVYLRVVALTGRLSSDLTYDDVGYALDAVQRYGTAARQGISAFLAGLVSDPPHSPWSTALALLGFTLAGIDDVSLYLANLLPFCGFLLLVLRTTRFAGTADRALGLALLASAPLAFRMVSDFRPDIVLGLVTALAVGWTAQACESDERVLQTRAGLAFGLALLIKPSFFAHTVAMLLFMLGLLVAVTLVRRSRRPRHAPGASHAWAPALRILGWATLVAASYYVFSWRHVFSYFWNNTRGAEAAIWSFPRTEGWLALAIDTWNLDAGMLGWHALLAALLVISALAWWRRPDLRGELRTLCWMCAAASVSFAIIVFGRHKNDYFLATMQWLLLLAAVRAMALQGAQLPWAGRAAFLVTTALLLALSIDGNRRIPYFLASVEASGEYSWNRQLVEAISRQAVLGNRWRGPPDLVAVYFPFSGPVNADSVSWLAAKSGLPIVGTDTHRSADLDLARQTAGQASFVVLPELTQAEYYRWLPSAGILEPFAAWLDSSARFERVALAWGNTTPHYRLYRNRSVTLPGEAVIELGPHGTLAGFSDQEGPYPQWSLPRLRWLRSPEGQVCFPAFGRQPVRILLSFRTPAAARVSVVSPAGESLASVQTVAQQFALADATLEHPGTPACLGVRVDGESLPEHEDHFALFTRIVVLAQAGAAAPEDPLAARTLRPGRQD